MSGRNDNWGGPVNSSERIPTSALAVLMGAGMCLFLLFALLAIATRKVFADGKTSQDDVFEAMTDQNPSSDDKKLRDVDMWDEQKVKSVRLVKASFG